ncbi:MAG: hypothetical protein I3273_06920 [Candidatus Moeniiplasma glomeromycotorum]|nr:hypothetical protein [Candidatus Moeniiplasma glomeromycotorum]MCE8168274.1 hypothetical protein [Candidatus Moeniiplasma glomeromycotorum]MCE8169818.1 hypothetical protein [Candidatus Moeniiplasma glomeromycotorum]
MVETRDISRELDELKNNYLRSFLDKQGYPQMKEQLEKIDDIQGLYYTNTPESRKKAKEIFDEIYTKLVNGVEAIFYNNSGIIDKIERGERITMRDLEYQLGQVKLFDLWAEKQRIIHFRLREIFYEQNEEDYWRQAVKAASQDEQRNKEIAAWDKIASKIRDK